MKKNRIVRLLSLLSAAIMLFSLCACSGGSGSSGEKSSEQSQSKKHTGTLIIELYPEYAPKTVENFLKLVNSGFYDGLTFHRIVDGQIVQGGDPKGTGFGGSDELIEGEFSANGFTQNTLSHERGVVSMARSSVFNSASSQFFICTSDINKDSYDGQYAAFGKVIEGLEAVDGFSDVSKVGEKPTEPIKMTKVVELKDYQNAVEGHSYVQMDVEYTTGNGNIVTIS